MRSLLSVVLTSLWLAGCGSSPQQEFVGSWTFASGTDNVSCPSGTTSTKLSGTITVTTTKDGGLQVLDPEGCNFTYSLSADNATVSNKSCSFAAPELGQGVTANVMYGTITLSTSDGKTMSDSFNGTVQYAASTGAIDCVFSGSASLARVGG